MRVNIDNDNDNWLKWGELVMYWINNPRDSWKDDLDPKKRRPKTVAELVETMKKNGICGNVPDADKYPNKPVVITDYSEAGPLYIWLPSKAALERELSKVVPERPYPLPNWYSVAFGCAPKDLAEGEGKAFAARRVGEYVIQECC